MFIVGAVAPGAAFADAKPRPVILLSHGFGGTARMMGWFGVPLARAGYVVIAVDHPGNNGMDKMTVGGAIMSWDRAQDLRAALDAVKADPAIGPHLDLKRLGVSGFSAGGFTSLVGAGAHVDLKVLPGVGHYDFLAACTPAGMATVPVCTAKVPQDQSHQAAIDMAVSFFNRTLGAP